MILEAGPLECGGPAVIYANAGASRQSGRTAGGLQGLALGALLPEPAVSRMLEWLSQLDTGSAERILPLRLGDGTEQRTRWSATATRDGAGQVLNFTLTFSPAQEMPLGETAGSVVSSSEEIPAPGEYHGDTIANLREAARRVAHEFNNALTAILMPLGMASRMAKSDPALHEKLQVAQIAAQKAAGLAKDFLDCYRPREAKKEPTDVRDLLGRTLRLGTVAEDVTWELEAAENLFPVMLDPEQIDRVIFNLVRNACDAMNHQGRFIVKAQNAVVPPDSPLQLPPGEYVSITVRDFGPGIPEEHRPHLFHSRFTTKPNGNGCGLPICYQIIRNHGGEMFVSSKVNVGTAFAIFLPALTVPAWETEAWLSSQPPEKAADTEVPAPPQTLHEPGAEHSSGNNDRPQSLPSLLIVEDDDAIRMITTKIVSDLGYDVMAAAEGDEALNILRSRAQENRPMASVLLDLNLRGRRSGLQTFEEIQRMAPETRVIATSGDHGSPVDFQRLGFSTFLPKPYSYESLDQTLREVLSA